MHVLGTTQPQTSNTKRESNRAGRRFLFLEGGIQMIFCEVAVGILIHFNFTNPGNSSLSSAIVALICIYVAGFAWSW